MSKFKNMVAGAVMAVGSMAGFAAQGKTQSNDTQSLNHPQAATQTVDRQSSLTAGMDIVRTFEQNGETYYVVKGDFGNVTMSHSALIERDQAVKDYHAKRDGIESAKTQEKQNVTSADLEQELTSHDQMFENNLDAEAEYHRKRAEWVQQMEEQNSMEIEVDVHMVKKSLREKVAAETCSIPLSADNLFHHFSAEEVLSLGDELSQMDPENKINLVDVYNLAKADCAAAELKKSAPENEYQQFKQNRMSDYERFKAEQERKMQSMKDASRSREAGGYER